MLLGKKHSNVHKRIFVGFGMMPMFASRVIMENHIFTSGEAQVDGKIYDQSESKIVIPTKVN